MLLGSSSHAFSRAAPGPGATRRRRAAAPPRNACAWGGGSGGGSSSAGGSGGGGRDCGARRRVADDGDGGMNGGDRGRTLRLLLASLGLCLLPAAAAPAAALARGRQPENADSGGLFGGFWGIEGIVSSRDAKGGGDGGGGIDSAQIEAFVDSMVAMWRPIVSNMGMSGLMGACAAAALKAVGRGLAGALGLSFVILQVLTYNGIVTVNWTKVHEKARAVLDSTGDGRLDLDDYTRSLKKGLVMLSQGLPSTSGFLLGFVLGLRVF